MVRADLPQMQYHFRHLLKGEKLYVAREDIVVL